MGRTGQSPDGPGVRVSTEVKFRDGFVADPTERGWRRDGSKGDFVPPVASDINGYRSLPTRFDL